MPSTPELAVRLDRAEEDIDRLSGAVARVEAVCVRVESATKDVPRMLQDIADIKLERAHEKGAAALRRALGSGAVAVFGAVLTLMGQYVLQRAVTPPQGPAVAAPQLSAEERRRLEEQWRLLEQREGYRPGQRLPGPREPQAPEPVPPSAPAVTP
jgi:hypothetical protein